MNIEGVSTQPDPYTPDLLSQAIKSGPFVFVSGQAGYDDNGQIVEGGFAAQGEQAFQNLNRALTAAGTSLDKKALYTPEAMIEIEAIALVDVHLPNDVDASQIETREVRSGQLRPILLAA